MRASSTARFLLLEVGAFPPLGWGKEEGICIAKDSIEPQVLLRLPWYQSPFGLTTSILSFHWYLNVLRFFSTTTAGFDTVGAVAMVATNGADWLLFGSTLLTSKSPFAILCTYNLTYSNTIGFPQPTSSLSFSSQSTLHPLHRILISGSSSVFYSKIYGISISPSVFSLKIYGISISPSTFYRDLPLESGRRTGLFANQVAVALLAKIGSFTHYDDCSGFNIVFVSCSRFPLLLLGLDIISPESKQHRRWTTIPPHGSDIFSPKPKQHRRWATISPQFLMAKKVVLYTSKPDCRHFHEKCFSTSLWIFQIQASRSFKSDAQLAGGVKDI